MTPHNPPANRWNLPDLGLGLGLRTEHVGTIVAERPAVGWFEVITENALHHRGRYRGILERLRADYPIVLHGVSLSIGGADPLDMDYLKQVKALADHLDVPWLSDHVCWTGVRGRNSHDLLPVAYDEATLAWMVERIRRVQGVLERPLMLENPSSYAAFSCTTMPEWEFIARMAEQADCGLLLDVNNIYVSSVNHQFDPWTYLDHVPWDRVTQLHVAGHTDRGSHLFDSHIGPVIDPVWQLLAAALKRSGGRATMLEWDDEIPAFEVVWQEAQRAAPMIAAARATSASTATTATAPEPHTDPARLATDGAAAGAPDAVSALQGWFFDAITGLRTATESEVRATVLPNPLMTAALRVSVYERMVAARLHEAMQQDFPATITALGEARFEAETTAYLADHPSRHWALERLGDRFADWLATRLDLEIPWLAACAALEWRLVTTGWQPWQAPLAAAALAAVPPERYADVQLTPASTTWLGRVDRRAVAALAEVWERAVDGLDANRSQVVDVLIFRAGWAIDLRVPSPVEAATLRALLDGGALGEAVVAGGEVGPEGMTEIGAHLGAWSRRWVADQVVSGLGRAEALVE